MMQDPVLQAVLPALLFAVCVAGLAALLLLTGSLFNRRRPDRVKRIPSDSGRDPIHHAGRRLDVRFHLLPIAFLVFSAALLFLYPWAVAFRPPPAAVEASEPARATLPATANGRPPGEPALKAGVARPRFMFAGGLVFIILLTSGFVYDWRKGIFQ